MIGLGLLLGLGAWTLIEYLLHRFVFHQGALGKRAKRGHSEHHRAPDFFYPMPDKIVGVAVFAALIAWPSAGLLGPGIGAGLPIGVALGWGIYEWIHRRVHVAAPVDLGPLRAYGRWARRHHLAHHFGHPALNHGVSTPLWDVVFGTLAPPGVVRIPRVHASTFPWLLDPERPAPWDADYEIVGRGHGADPWT